MMTKREKVVHITTAHKRHDVRVFLKECRSLAKANYDVTLIVADGCANEVVDGVAIISVPRQKSRLRRIIFSSLDVYKEAMSINASLYHLHDPELLTIAPFLKKTGSAVVFDAHEDFPQQLINKPYLKYGLGRFISLFASFFENKVCASLSAVVSATPVIADKFRKINTTVAVNNYPILEDVKLGQVDWMNKGNVICYVGGVAADRGIYESVKAFERSEKAEKLIIAGICRDIKVTNFLKSVASGDDVEYRGFLDRPGVAEVYAQSVIGLVTLHPLNNYLDALPVKMFEYMGAGIPVIASNFPLWKTIIEDAGCGICVDPYSVEEISAAIDFILSDPLRARTMGDNGRRLVESKYNWAKEEDKLLGLYRSILEPRYQNRDAS